MSGRRVIHQSLRRFRIKQYMLFRLLSSSHDVGSGLGAAVSNLGLSGKTRIFFSVRTCCWPQLLIRGPQSLLFPDAVDPSPPTDCVFRQICTRSRKMQHPKAVELGLLFKSNARSCMYYSTTYPAINSALPSHPYSEQSSALTKERSVFLRIHRGQEDVLASIGGRFQAPNDGSL